MAQSSECACARRFTIALGRTSDYQRARSLLDANKARLPTYIGRNMIVNYAADGGLLFAQYEGEDVAVMVVNARHGTFSAMSVVDAHAGHGLGTAITQYLRPNFARVIVGWQVDWFVKMGYVAVGEPFQGRKFATQVMVRGELRDLSGRVDRLYGEECRCCG